MLFIRPVAASGYRYYLSGVGPAGLGDQGVGEVPGRWLGRAAGALGCEGPFGALALRRLLAGDHPGSGEALVAGRANRLAGLDLVFAAPKSVSIAASLADPEVAAHLLAAHDRAVDAALAYLEVHACAVRRGAARLAGEGFAGAAFRHRTSRAADPHLHTHVVVANLTVADGRWSALHSPLLFAEARAAGAVYAAVLRRGAIQSGLPWRAVAPGRWELDGVPRAVIDIFSRRHIEVMARVSGDRGGAAEGRTPAGAVRLTRPPRPRRASVDDLTTVWRARAGAAGFEPPGWWRGESCRPAHRDDQDPGYDRAMVGGRGDTFTRADLVQLTCAALPDGASLEEIERRVEQRLHSPEFISVGRARPFGPAVVDGPEGPRARYLPTAFVAVAEELAQRESVLLCAAGSGGVGADRLATFARCAAAEGRVVVGAATGVAAARRFEAATGIVSGPIGVVSGEFEAADGGRLSGRPLVVVGDGNGVTTSELARLAEAAGLFRASVVIAGVPGRGGPFDRLAELVGPSRWLDPVAGAPSIDDAVSIATPGGTLTGCSSPALARQRAVEDWWAARSAGAEVVLTVSDRGDVAGVSALAAEVTNEGSGRTVSAVSDLDGSVRGPLFVIGGASPRRSGPLLHRYVVLEPGALASPTPADAHRWSDAIEAARAWAHEASARRDEAARRLTAPARFGERQDAAALLLATWDARAARAHRALADLTQRERTAGQWPNDEANRAAAARAALLGQLAERTRPALLEPALGAPPSGPLERQSWRRAAGAALRYREAWRVSDRAVLLGPPAADADQRTDRRRVEQTLAQARRHLDRDPPGHDRGHGLAR